jgi:hypothetical protein
MDDYGGWRRRMASVSFRSSAPVNPNPNMALREFWQMYFMTASGLVVGGCYAM